MLLDPDRGGTGHWTAAPGRVKIGAHTIAPAAAAGRGKDARERIA